MGEAPGWPDFGVLGGSGAVQTFLGVPWCGTIVLGVVRFTHPNSRYPKTPLLTNRVQTYGCLGRHPRTQTIFFAPVQFKHPILGIQKHFCWPIEYSGKGVWGSPELKQYFLAWCSSNTPILGIQKHLCWLIKYSDMHVWGAAPEPKQFFPWQ